MEVLVKKKKTTADTFFNKHRNMNIIDMIISYGSFSEIFSLFKLNKNMKKWIGDRYSAEIGVNFFI